METETGFDEMMVAWTPLEEGLVDDTSVQEEPIVQQIRNILRGVPQSYQTICTYALQGCQGTRSRVRFERTCQNHVHAHLNCDYNKGGQK